MFLGQHLVFGRFKGRYEFNEQCTVMQGLDGYWKVVLSSFSFIVLRNEDNAVLLHCTYCMTQSAISLRVRIPRTLRSELSERIFGMKSSLLLLGKTQHRSVLCVFYINIYTTINEQFVYIHTIN